MPAFARSDVHSRGRMPAKNARTSARDRGTSAGLQVCSSAATTHSAQNRLSSAGVSGPGPNIS